MRNLLNLLDQLPKPISPKAHALFDLCAFPVMVGTGVWVLKRNVPAATLIFGNALLEGTNAAITDFPPSLIPLISFRTHVTTGVIGTPLFTAIAALMPGVPRRYRWRIMLALGLVPFLLNALSDTSKQPR